MLISHSRTNTGEQGGNAEENTTFLLISCHSLYTDEYAGPFPLREEMLFLMVLKKLKQKQNLLTIFDFIKV